MRMVSGTFMAVALLAATLTAAQASDLSYDYLEANIVTDTNATILKNTYQIKFSNDIRPNVNILGSYEYGRDAEGRNSLSYSGAKLGVGMHKSTSDTTDVFLEAAVVKLDNTLTVDWYKEKYSVTGLTIGAGIRTQVNDRLETSARIDLLSVENITDTTVAVGGQFNFSERLSAGISLENTHREISGSSLTGNNTVVVTGVRFSSY